MRAIQRDRAWIADASEAEVAAAYNAGELQVALGRSPDAPIQRGEGWVKAATPEQIDAAHSAGELVTYMGGQINEFGNPVDANGKVIRR